VRDASASSLPMYTSASARFRSRRRAVPAKSSVSAFGFASAPSARSAPARRAAARVGQDPDLQESARASRDGLNSPCVTPLPARSCLQIAGLDHAAVAHRVAVLELPFEHVGEDLGVAVPVLPEALPGQGRRRR
jgi:hypothetical protein